MDKVYREYSIPGDQKHQYTFDPKLYALPPDITKMDYEEIGLRMGILTEHQIWLSRSVLLLNVKINEYTERILDREAYLSSVLSSTRKDFTYRLRNDTTWSQLNAILKNQENKRAILAAEVAAVDKRLVTLSREQSRREILLKKRIYDG